MTIDLDSMSRNELMALKKKVDKALASFEKRQREAALAAAQKAAQEHGFSLDEIMGRKSAAKTSVPKYRNPENPTQTWTGRGRQPAWYKQAIESGKQPADLEI
ncbi:MAG: transcriptional regulator [Rhodobacteraceae bacterium CG17_big_fil_post_rev_8_21_14_2_50_65_11]|nr:MAG: transcriptional regulator [Rhodobacteraceae bacterium CG17_big_fil_post_rev_8_21_14_2_50_65_11]